MTTKRICGFECGVNNNTAHVTLGTHAAFDTSIFRSGGTFGRSVRVNLSAQNDATFLQLLGLGNTFVGRIYVYFATLPDANTLIFRIADGLIFHGVGFKASDGKLYAARSNSGVITFGATGVAVSAGQWYKLGVRVIANGTTIVTDVEVAVPGEDAVSAAQLSQVNGSSLQSDTVAFGSTANVTADMYFDDVNIADASGDYPLAEGSSLPFIPTSDGSHNIAGANQFERGTTGVDITNATTTAYQLVDELPMDDGTPAVDDYIAAIAPSSGNDYVEVKFGAAPGVTLPVDPPTSVEVIVGYHGGLGGDLKLSLVDDGAVDTIVSKVGWAGSSVVNFASKHYADPPSSATSWTLASGPGNFLDLRIRFYSADALPDQYFDGALLEVDFGLSQPPPPPGGYYACAGTLPTFETADQDKIDALKDLRAAGTGIQPFEIVKISWPSPTDPIYYAVLQTDEIASVAPPVSPIQARIIPDSRPDWFLPVEIDHSIGDEEVDLVFWDGDGEISDLLVDHGEGIKVELYYWFPQVELMLPIWHGHLRQEDDAEIDIVKLKAVQGFRSSEGLLPRRAHYQQCQAIFGGVFDTQAQIDENDCPYNRHIGGSTGNLNGGSPFTSCPRRTRQDCIDRLSNSANFMLSHATVSTIIPNNQTKGPRLFSTSQGNETNLKDPVTVVMGTRRVYAMPVLAYRKDLNNNNPDHGFIFLIFEICEGPVRAIFWPNVTFGSDDAPADPFNFNYRLGTQGQGPVDTALTVHSYSSTALMRCRSPWVNPEDVDISSVSGSVMVDGLNNIRIYTDENTYTEEWTDNRAWQIMKMLTDKRWGYGYDYERLDIPSFIEAACWCANVVQFTDVNGDTWNHIRAASHVELRGRKVQQQIEDMCMAGRLSRPFLFNGKIHIVPLREMTAAELAAAPVFTDEGENRNIIQEEIEKGVFRTTLKRSRTSDLELPNRVECTYDDASKDYAEQPLRPIEDIDAQLAAGRVVGDHSQKPNIKKYGLTGVVFEGQGVKVAQSLLDLGPFDEGGLANNLRLKFKIWFIDSLILFPTMVIKVESSQITRYGFDYFRVVTMKRLENLEVELTVQAYNADYMASFEVLYGVIDPMPIDPPDPDPPAPDPPTDPLVFGDVSYSNGTLTINCEATS